MRLEVLYHLVNHCWREITKVRQGQLPLPVWPPWGFGSGFSAIFSLLTLCGTLPLLWGKEGWVTVVTLLLVNVSEQICPLKRHLPPPRCLCSTVKHASIGRNEQPWVLASPDPQILWLTSAQINLSQVGVWVGSSGAQVRPSCLLCPGCRSKSIRTGAGFSSRRRKEPRKLSQTSWAHRELLSRRGRLYICSRPVAEASHMARLKVKGGRKCITHSKSWPGWGGKDELGSTHPIQHTVDDAGRLVMQSCNWMAWIFTDDLWGQSGCSREERGALCVVYLIKMSGKNSDFQNFDSVYSLDIKQILGKNS